MDILQKEQQSKAAELLVLCFLDNPMFISLMPNEQKRKQLLKPLFECLLAYTMQVGTIYITSKNLEGMIASVKEHPLNQLKRPFLFYGECAWRLITQVSWLTLITAYWRYHTKKRTFLTLPKNLSHLTTYYSIQMFAVAPTQRHKGHARALLDCVLGQAQAEHLPCLLETETLSNVAMYKHFNFKVIGTLEYGKKEWRQYIMQHEG